jgi:hypothetical protein
MSGITRRITVQLLDEQFPDRRCSVEGLMAEIQRGVRCVRDEHPDLDAFHLHDVSLRLADGNLLAELDFRR